MVKAILVVAVALALSVLPIGAVERFTLQECLKRALTTHPLIDAAQREKEAAIARLRQAQSQLLPELNFNGFQRFQGPIISFTVPAPPPLSPRTFTVLPRTTQTLGLEVRQNVYDGGRFTAAIRGASYLVHAASENLRAARARLILQVTEAYADVLAAEAMAEVARQALQRIEALREVTKARYEAGAAPKFEVLRVEAEREAVREQFLAAQNAVALAKAALNQLLGRPTDAPLALEPLPPLTEIDPQKLTSRLFLHHALANRPEIRAMDWQVRMWEQRVRFAKADQNPLIFLTGSYQRQTATAFARDFSWSLNLIVQIPLFDSGRRKGILKEQEAMLRKALAQREQLERQIRLEVERSVRALQVALQRLKAAEAGARVAREAFRLARVRYKAGVGTQVEVLEAQVALTRARARFVRAFYEAQKAFARLTFATGLSSPEVLALLKNSSPH